MIKWEELDRTVVPDGGGELRLMRRGAELSIMTGAVELMNSRLHGSEEALATLVFARIGERPGAHVLIGGLGMGFTLRAAQTVARADAKLTVAELVPTVIAWARGPMSELFGDSLSDPRVVLHEGDVTPLILNGLSRFDAILLDVDNGPEGLIRKANDGLYDTKGLAAARRALRPSGVLAVWSSDPNPAFAARLRKSGMAVEELPIRARHRGRGARHVIWLATKIDGPSAPRQAA